MLWTSWIGCSWGDFVQQCTRSYATVEWVLIWLEHAVFFCPCTKLATRYTCFKDSWETTSANAHRFTCMLPTVLLSSAHEASSKAARTSSSTLSLASRLRLCSAVSVSASLAQACKHWILMCFSCPLVLLCHVWPDGTRLENFAFWGDTYIKSCLYMYIFLCLPSFFFASLLNSTSCFSSRPHITLPSTAPRYSRDCN